MERERKVSKEEKGVSVTEADTIVMGTDGLRSVQEILSAEVIEEFQVQIHNLECSVGCDCFSDMKCKLSGTKQHCSGRECHDKWEWSQQWIWLGWISFLRAFVSMGGFGSFSNDESGKQISLIHHSLFTFFVVSCVFYVFLCLRCFIKLGGAQRLSLA